MIIHRNEFIDKQTVLITGATGGLGKAFAVECARRGWDLFLTDRSENHLNTLAAALGSAYGIQVETHPCDLIDAQDVELPVRGFDNGADFPLGIIEGSLNHLVTIRAVGFEQILPIHKFLKHTLFFHLDQPIPVL